MYFIYSKYLIDGVTWEIIQTSPRSNYIVKKDGEKVHSVPMFHMALEVMLNQFKVDG